MIGAVVALLTFFTKDILEEPLRDEIQDLVRVKEDFRQQQALDRVQADLAEAMALQVRELRHALKPSHDEELRGFRHDLNERRAKVISNGYNAVVDLQNDASLDDDDRFVAGWAYSEVQTIMFPRNKLKRDLSREEQWNRALRALGSLEGEVTTSHGAKLEKARLQKQCMTYSPTFYLSLA